MDAAPRTLACPRVVERSAGGHEVILAIAGTGRSPGEKRPVFLSAIQALIFANDVVFRLYFTISETRARRKQAGGGSLEGCSGVSRVRDG